MVAAPECSLCHFEDVRMATAASVALDHYYVELGRYTGTLIPA